MEKQCSGRAGERHVRRMAAMVGLVALAGIADAQPVLQTGTIAAGELPLSLRAEPGRMYRWKTSTNLSTWSDLPAAIASRVPLVPPGTGTAAVSLNLGVPVSGTRQFFRVEESRPFDPAWAGIAPLRRITYTFNTNFTFAQNGAALKTAIDNLIPGDRLEISPGTYSFVPRTSITRQGTAQAPIWITTGPQGGVTFTRPDANQNLIELGADGPVRFLAIQGINFTGGSMGIRLGDCINVWIDRCKVTNTDSSGISATSKPTSNLHITRNEVSYMANDGDGIAIGQTNGDFISTNCVIALNHVHHGTGTNSIGDGIDVKRGSWGNLVSGNLVHNISTAGILVFPGSASGRNIIENNIVHTTADAGLYVNSHCTVRNNLVFGSNFEALSCANLAGINPSNATITNNTIIGSAGTAARLALWNTGTGLIFANNACYSQAGAAIQMNSTSGTAVFAGQVTFGTVSSNIPAGTYTPGTGLADFTNLSWNAVNLDASPSATSPLRSAASATHAPEYDQLYHLRTAPHTTGSRR